MRIQNNIPGMNNVRIGKGLNSKMSKAMRRLSTGTRVAIAADDAAGLAVSEKIRALMSEQTRCVINTEEGVGVAQTADGALAEVCDMMHRAQQLCVQAKNGTYSEEDRAHITEEINALYDEMERIFVSSELNELKLFNADGYNPAGEDSILREYIETVTSPTALQAWGELDCVGNKQFDPAKDAENASVTLKLDSSTILNDASSLNGKSFVLSTPSNDPIRITFSSSPKAYSGYTSYERGSDGKYYMNYTVATKDCTTVEDALNLLVERTNTDSFFTARNCQLDANETVLDAANREITFAFKLNALEQTINGSTYQTDEASGAYANAYEISSTEEASLGLIDGTDSTDNTTVYSNTSTATLPFLPGRSGTLSDTDITALTRNTLSMTDGPTINFTTTGEAGKIDISGKTAEQVRDAILDEINNYRDSEGNKTYSAEYDQDGNVVLTRLNCETDDLDYTSITESVSGDTKDAPALPVSITTTPATGEKPMQCVISLPADISLPATLTVGSFTYTFVQSEPNLSVSGLDGNSIWTVSDPSDVSHAVASLIRSAYSPNVTTSVKGNTITVDGKYAAKDLTISVSGSDAQIEVSKRVLLNYSQSLSQTASIPLDLSQAMSGETALSDLNGKGFVINVGSYTNRYYEFVCSPATKTNPSATAIDITGCTSYDDIAQAIERTLDKNFTSTVTHKGNGAMSIDIPTGSTITFQDGLVGMDGLFLNAPGTKSYDVSGGTDATQPQSTIDFSQYNERNFDQLYGKGFRITCATCEGEYINIIFCHDAATANIPSTKTNGVDANGNPITFTNYAVELKDMKNGSDIVRNIVDQLKGKLDHFTDVAVGTPSSVLMVMDKRAGNLDINGVPMRAEILSGVYTDCTYDVEVIEHVNQNALIGGPGGSTSAYYGYCPVYLGSTDDGVGNWVVVHLPTLSLELLNLDPPRPDLRDVASIDDVMDRLTTAENVVLTARAQLGADQNRLEHAQRELRNAAEQSTASYSTIKDADMASELMEQTKLSILQNFQQSTLSHIFKNATSVLELLY